MVLIKNEQNSREVNTTQLQKDAQSILELLDYADFDLGILLATDEEIHELNKKFRHKDKPTDILSFPFFPHLKAGQRIEVASEDEKNLGDIVIAPNYVYTTLDQWDTSFDERMRVLLVHGICHLLGYDHIKDEDYEVMKKQEEFLLNALKHQ